MKRIYIILIIFLFIFTLAGCSSNKIVIPVVASDYNNLFISELIDELDNHLMDKYVIKVYDSKDSQVIQNEIIIDLLEDEVKLIVVNPVDRIGAYAVIEKAKETDTSLIFFNSEPLEKDLQLSDNVFYVGAKPEQAGILQAVIVMDIMGGNPDDLNEFDLNNDNKIQCIILKGKQGEKDAEIRTNSVIDELELNGYNLDVLSLSVADFDTNTAEEVMDKLIKTYENEIELVISNNDAMAIGAIKSLTKNGMLIDNNYNGVLDMNTSEWLPVVGIDGISEAHSLIEIHKLYGTVASDSESMSQAIMELSNAIVSNKNPKSINFNVIDDKYIWIDCKKYTAIN